MPGTEILKSFSTGISLLNVVQCEKLVSVASSVVIRLILIGNTCTHEKLFPLSFPDHQCTNPIANIDMNTRFLLFY